MYTKYHNIKIPIKNRIKILNSFFKFKLFSLLNLFKINFNGLNE